MRIFWENPTIVFAFKDWSTLVNPYNPSLSYSWELQCYFLRLLASSGFSNPLSGACLGCILLPDYSRMRIQEREARRVLLGYIQIPEWAEYYSDDSASEGGMNRTIMKTVYLEEWNKSKKCSFCKIHEPAILLWLFSLPLIGRYLVPRPTLPTNEMVFELLILLVDNIPSNPLE